MIIKVKVKPNSKSQKIEKIKENEYEVKLKSKPEDNKANLELIKLMKKHLNKEIKIIKGLKSKNKVLKVENLKNANKI